MKLYNIGTGPNSSMPTEMSIWTSRFKLNSIKFQNSYALHWKIDITLIFMTLERCRTFQAPTTLYVRKLSGTSPLNLALLNLTHGVVFTISSSRFISYHMLGKFLHTSSFPTDCPFTSLRMHSILLQTSVSHAEGLLTLAESKAVSYKDKTPSVTKNFLGLISLAR